MNQKRCRCIWTVGLLTSMTVDENFLLPCHMRVVILVTNGHCQGACHGFRWLPTVAHDNGDEKFFLPLTVKSP